MITSERKRLHRACKISIMNMVSDNDLIRERLEFTEHVDMLKWVSELDYETSVSIVFNNAVMLDEFGIRDFEGKFRKFLKYGLAAIAGGIMASRVMMITPIGLTVGAVTYYLFRKATDPCWQNCLSKFGKSSERKVCKYQCQAKAAKSIVNDVKAQIGKCDGTKNPLGCEKKLNKEYIKWSKKLEEQLVKLQQASANLKIKQGG
jgi:hypothetical protein